MNLDSLRENMGKFLLAAGGVLLLVVVVYVALNLGRLLFPPQLIQASPRDGATEISPFTTVAFKFDENLSQDNKSAITIFPSAQINVVVSGTIIEVIPTRHLDYGQTYTVSLKEPKNSIGRSGNAVAVSFTVKTRDKLDSEDLRRLQGETDQNFLEGVSQGQNQTLLKRAQVRESLLAQLPYQTNTFKVEYLIDGDTFKVTVLKNPYEANKQAALDWFKANGVTDLNWFSYAFDSVRGVY